MVTIKTLFKDKDDSEMEPMKEDSSSLIKAESEDNVSEPSMTEEAHMNFSESPSQDIMEARADIDQDSMTETEEV